jgi:hypothetical protein
MLLCIHQINFIFLVPLQAPAAKGAKEGQQRLTTFGAGKKNFVLKISGGIII